jgi:hypothetical protein
MKIAILYSGLINNNIEEYYNNHFQYILSQYKNIDIYISTYDISNSESIEDLEKLFDIKTLHVESWQSVINKLEEIQNIIHTFAHETKILNTLSMFYKLKQCYNLIQAKKYDIVIRNRIDLKFDNFLVLDKNLYLNVPAGGDHRGGLLDLFAYGSQEIMQKYCSIYDYLTEYILNNTTIFHPESLLRYHCNNLGLPLNRFRYNIYLRNMNFTQTAPCIY